MFDKKRSIGKASAEVGVDTHVIRFWQTYFPEINPEIGPGKRRYFYDKQIELLKKIKHYLYVEGYTIAGLRHLLDKGVLDQVESVRIAASEHEFDLNLVSDHLTRIRINLGRLRGIINNKRCDEA